MSPEAIAALPPGGVLHDPRVPGLHVRAFAARKAFYVYFRTKLHRERRPKLGDVGVITLTQAREIARRMLAEVAAGGDPVLAREQQREAPTVDALWAAYEQSNDAPRKALDQYRRIYRRDVAPRLGGLLVPAVSGADVERLHGALAASPYLANRAVAVLGALFSHAERRGWRSAGTNPARGIRRYREVSRERYAAPGEARAIMDALSRRAQAHPCAVGFVLLCLFTGARPDEIVRARPEWIGGTILRLPDSKTGRRAIHLSPQAIAIIDWLRPHAAGTITGLRRPPRKLWEAVRREAGCGDLRLYDLRHTFASAAIAATGSLDLTGRLLGHVRHDTTLVYAHLMAAEGAAAATQTGRLLEEKLLGAPLALPKPEEFNGAGR